MHKIKHKNHKGVALIFVMGIIVAMTIMGTSLLMFSNRESKGALAEQRYTRSYYAARSGAEVIDKFVSSTKTQEIEKIYAQYESKDMLFGGKNEKDNLWYPVSLEKAGVDASGNPIPPTDNEAYFQIIFKKKNYKGIQIISRGAVVDPNANPTMKVRDKIIKENKSEILCTYKNMSPMDSNNQAIPTVIDTGVYVKSELKMRGGSEITYSADGTKGPAIMAGITNQGDFKFEQNYLGSKQYPKIEGDIYVTPMVSNFGKMLVDKGVIKSKDNFHVVDEDPPRNYEPVELPTSHSNDYSSSKILDMVRYSGNYNTYKLTGDPRVLDTDIKCKDFTVSGASLGPSELVVNTSKNLNIVADKMEVNNHITFSGGGIVDIHVNTLDLDSWLAGRGSIYIKDGTTVNFYVNDYLTVGGTDTTFNFDNQELSSMQRLNIFYYGTSPVDFNRTKWRFKGTLVVKSADINIKNAVGDVGGAAAEVRPFFVGNIFSGGGNINITPGLLSSESYRINAFVYAPYSKVKLAPNAEGVATAYTASKTILAGSIICDSFDMGLNSKLFYNAVPPQTLPNKPSEFAVQLDKLSLKSYSKEGWDRIE